MDLTQVCWFVEWIRWGRKRTAACEADWYVFNRRASVQHQQTCVRSILCKHKMAQCWISGILDSAVCVTYSSAGERFETMILARFLRRLTVFCSPHTSDLSWNKKSWTISTRKRSFSATREQPEEGPGSWWGARGEKRENGMSMGATIGPFMMSIFLLDF